MTQQDIARLRALTTAGDQAAAWALLLWSRRRDDPTDEAAARRVIGGDGLTAWMARANIPRLPTADARRVLCEATALLATRHRDGFTADAWGTNTVEVWSPQGAHADATSSLHVVSLQPAGDGWRKVGPDGLALPPPTPPQPPSITAYGMPPLDPSQFAVLAPESLRGERPSLSTDVYALAIIGFIAWTGTTPFLDGTPTLTELMLRIVHPARSLPLAQMQDPSPDADTLRAVLLKALQANPSLRFPNASTMHAALEPHPPAVLEPHPPSPSPRESRPWVLSLRKLWSRLGRL